MAMTHLCRLDEYAWTVKFESPNPPSIRLINMNSETDILHKKRLQDEIESHLREVLDIDELSQELLTYVNDQVTDIYRCMCLEEHDNGTHPFCVDPDLEEDDYYRESIEEYGSVYQDYPNDE